MFKTTMLKKQKKYKKGFLGDGQGSNFNCQILLNRILWIESGWYTQMIDKQCKVRMMLMGTDAMLAKGWNDTGSVAQVCILYEFFEFRLAAS